MSKPVARVGVDLLGGGVIQGPGASTVTVNDKPCSIVGDIVATHGNPPHVQPTIVVGAPTIFAENKQVSLVSVSTATCAHSVSTGSGNTLGL